MSADPDDPEGQVRGYVCAVVPGCSTDRITHVRRLDPGENHDVYRVSFLAPEATDVVVRIATSERARDCALAEREAAVLRKMRGVSAPILHDFRCESRWFDGPTMCSQFIDGEQRPPVDANEVEQLGLVVGGLHALPTDDLNGWLTTGFTLEGYLDTRVVKIDERLPLVRDPLPASVQLRLRRARSRLDEALESARSADAFRNGERLVLLHGDVAGGNLLWSPAPILIDWEYARMGDAADEIAYIFDQNGLSDPHRKAFWRGYREGRGPEHSTQLVERVSWWEPATELGSAFFWVELWSRRATAQQTGAVDPFTPKEQKYYGGQTMHRLQRAETLLDALGV